MPNIRLVCAVTITAFALSIDEFRSECAFAAWPSLVFRHHSSGGDQRLGHTIEDGRRDTYRLMIIGTMSIAHCKGRGGGRPGDLAIQYVGPKATYSNGDRNG
ncbi:IS110 family transposase [Agrobacterium tumefaciens]|nr:IS110 family transposase [Agrobacterium tumefaciens]